MYKEYASKQFVEEYLKNYTDEMAQQSDWFENDENSMAYVLNRPGGYVETNLIPIYEDKVYTFVDGTYEENSDINYPWITPNYYKIIWDNDEYICFCEEGGAGGAQSISCPFGTLIADGNFIHINAYDSNGNDETGTTVHTISVYKIEETPVKFDEKYLPPFAGKKVEGLSFNINDEDSYAQKGAEIFNDYENNIAIGAYSHAEGAGNSAIGGYSHVEGICNNAVGFASHIEGEANWAEGDYSHVEGFEVGAYGYCAHAEGHWTQANGSSSHAEGNESIAQGRASHAEGYNTQTIGTASHAEGASSYAAGYASHAEGSGVALGSNSHAEGEGDRYINKTITISSVDDNSYYTYTYIINSEDDVSIGNVLKYEYYDEEEFYDYENFALVESYDPTTKIITLSNELDEYNYSTFDNQEVSVYVEGFSGGYNSHTEGYYTTAANHSSHAEGEYSIASGYASHAEGEYTIASGEGSHAEGAYVDGIGGPVASGLGAHAEGAGTTASGEGSHAEGYSTIASGNYQHVQGKNNIADTTSAHIIGNGSDENNRSNAHTLDWEGNAWFAGDVYIGSTSGINKDEGSKKLASIDDIAQSDWNQNDGTASDYIKNRPFYEISDSFKVYEGDITFSQSNGQYKFYQQVDDIGRAGSIPRIVINADGTELVGEYQNNGKFVVSYDNDIYAISLLMQLGNMEFVTLPDGSETAIWGPTTYYLQVISESGKALFDCTVYADYYYMKKIDEKYLPDGIGTQPDWNQNDATKSDYVKNRTHWIESEAHWTSIDSTGAAFVGETISVSGMNSISQFSGMYQLSNCNKYRITVNGVEYIAEASYDANSGYYTIDPGSLFIWFNESELNMQNNDSKISSNMSIKIESYIEAVYHPLDEKFLPDTIATKADIEAAIGNAIGGSY